MNILKTLKVGTIFSILFPNMYMKSDIENTFISEKNDSQWFTRAILIGGNYNQKDKKNISC